MIWDKRIRGIAAVCSTFSQDLLAARPLAETLGGPLPWHVELADALREASDHGARSRSVCRRREVEGASSVLPLFTAVPRHSPPVHAQERVDGGRPASSGTCGARLRGPVLHRLRFITRSRARRPPKRGSMTSRAPTTSCSRSPACPCRPPLAHSKDRSAARSASASRTCCGRGTNPNCYRAQSLPPRGARFRAQARRGPMRRYTSLLPVAARDSTDVDRALTHDT